MNIPITNAAGRFDDEDDLEDGTGPITPSRILRAVAYASTALWAVTVVVGMWNGWSRADLAANGVPNSIRMAARTQAIIASLTTPWGYLLVAVIAYVAASVLAQREVSPDT